jgi:hypothetical protein
LQSEYFLHKWELGESDDDILLNSIGDRTYGFLLLPSNSGRDRGHFLDADCLAEFIPEFALGILDDSNFDPDYRIRCGAVFLLSSLMPGF